MAMGMVFLKRPTPRQDRIEGGVAAGGSMH
jgi:hypothetical protein